LRGTPQILGFEGPPGGLNTTFSFFLSTPFFSTRWVFTLFRTPVGKGPHNKFCGGAHRRSWGGTPPSGGWHPPCVKHTRGVGRCSPTKKKGAPFGGFFWEQTTATDAAGSHIHRGGGGVSPQHKQGGSVSHHT